MLTLQEVADILRINRSSISRLLKSNDLSYIALGGRKLAEREWATVLGIEDAKGLIHYCDDKKNNKPGAYLIDRHADFKATQDEAFRQASYLAKLRGKEDRPKGAWSVTGTRIPSRHKHED